jgi:hypothetical protein
MAPSDRDAQPGRHRRVFHHLARSALTYPGAIPPPLRADSALTLPGARRPFTSLYCPPEVCEGARGQGLLQGLVLKPGFSAREAVTRALELGYLIIGAGERVLRFAPPLAISDAQITEGIDATRRLIAALQRSAG